MTIFISRGAQLSIVDEMLSRQVISGHSFLLYEASYTQGDSVIHSSDIFDLAVLKNRWINFILTSKQR